MSAEPRSTRPGDPLERYVRELLREADRAQRFPRAPVPRRALRAAPLGVGDTRDVTAAMPPESPRTE